LKAPVPELDFVDTQIAKADRRSSAQRTGDRLALAAVLLGFYALFLVGLAIDSVGWLVAYLFAIAAGFMTLGRILGTRAWLERHLALDKVFAFVLLALMLIAYPIIFIGDAYLIHVATLAGIFVIMALGLNITLGFAGLLDAGFAVYFAAGAYTSSQLAVTWGVPFWIGMPLGGLVAALFGFVIAWPALRVQGHYLAMVTLGYGLIMNILHRNVTFLTNGTDGVLNIPPPSIADFEFIKPLRLFGIDLPFQMNFYYLVLVLVGLTIFLSYRLLNSSIGRSWEAIREDEIAAKCFGINLTHMKVLAFSTGAFFGGIGGATFAHQIGFIHPDNFVLITSITILAMVLIGGMGNVLGVAFGAVALIFLPERLREFENLRLLLFGIAMTLIMVLRPQGLFPSFRRRREIEAEKMQTLIQASGKAQSQAQPTGWGEPPVQTQPAAK
jgi:branched-chain amino acid transport system permease protein